MDLESDAGQSGAWWYMKDGMVNGERQGVLDLLVFLKEKNLSVESPYRLSNQPSLAKLRHIRESP